MCGYNRYLPKHEQDERDEKAFVLRNRHHMCWRDIGNEIGLTLSAAANAASRHAERIKDRPYPFGCKHTIEQNMEMLK